MNILSEMIQLHVFRREQGNAEYLVLQRAPDEPIYPNLWQVITGTVEPGETAAEAAIRELHEETGIEERTLLTVPYVASFFSPRQDAVQMVPVFAVEAQYDDKVQISAEHQAYRWCGYQEAYDTLVLPSHRQGMQILRDYILSGLFPGRTEY